MESRKIERITEVDRSSGSVIFIRPPSKNDRGKTHTIYAKPAKGDQPDDLARFSSIDAAYTYLRACKVDKDLEHEDHLKAAFGLGIFVGMSIIYGLVYYLGI